MCRKLIRRVAQCIIYRKNSLFCLSLQILLRLRIRKLQSSLMAMVSSRIAMIKVATLVASKA